MRVAIICALISGFVFAMGSSVIRYVAMLFPSVLNLAFLISLFASFGPATVDARPQPRLHARQSSDTSDPPCTGFFDSQCTPLIS